MVAKETVTVDFVSLTIVECVEEIGDNPQFDGTAISDVASIRSIYVAEDNGHLICTWGRQGDLEKVREELQEAQNEIQARDSILTNIKDAITALGDGIPTLSKLIAFLNAVKESIHYDRDNSAD